MPERLSVKSRNINSLRAFKGNARTHSKKQLKQLAASIQVRADTGASAE